jgi:hypothetical protein
LAAKLLRLSYMYAQGESARPAGRLTDEGENCVWHTSTWLEHMVGSVCSVSGKNHVRSTWASVVWAFIACDSFDCLKQQHPLHPHPCKVLALISKRNQVCKDIGFTLAHINTYSVQNAGPIRLIRSVSLYFQTTSEALSSVSYRPSCSRTTRPFELPPASVFLENVSPLADFKFPRIRRGNIVEFQKAEVFAATKSFQCTACSCSLGLCTYEPERNLNAC